MMVGENIVSYDSPDNFGLVNFLNFLSQNFIHYTFTQLFHCMALYGIIVNLLVALMLSSLICIVTSYDDGLLRTNAG